MVRTSPTTTLIKEPGVPEVKIRNSDIAKFVTEAERNTDLWTYDFESKRNPRAPEYYRFERSVGSVSDQESIPMPKQARITHPVIETVIQEVSSQPPFVKTSFKLPVASPMDPQIRSLTNMPPNKEYEYAAYKREVSMSVLDAENLIQNFYKTIHSNLSI